MKNQVNLFFWSLLDKNMSLFFILAREHSQPPVILMRTPSLSNGSEDTTMSFVSKYARLAPIVSTQSYPINGNSSSLISTDENYHEQTLDISSFQTDDLFQASDMSHSNDTLDDIEENYSYVPLKEQMKNLNGVPLLELDELETNSDISESQLVPIIYAKELANEIDLLQKAHLLKQQQRSIAMNNDNERINDNNSVPPPANMELLNFETLEEEFSMMQRQEYTPLPSHDINNYGSIISTYTNKT